MRVGTSTSSGAMSAVEDRGVQMSRVMFSGLLAELARRGHGRRESGAFLLARREPPGTARPPDRPQVVAVAYFDDLDTGSLTGGITFGATGYAALNARCRAEGLRVVGDIHTHPHNWVAQSNIDAAHPMSAREGHIALIAPNYGRGRIALVDLGAHVFNAPGWTSHFGNQVATIITLTGSAAIAGIVRRVRGAAELVRNARRWRGARERA
jgi:hypothetical protein